MWTNAKHQMIDEVRKYGGHGTCSVELMDGPDISGGSSREQGASLSQTSVTFVFLRLMATISAEL